MKTRGSPQGNLKANKQAPTTCTVQPATNSKPALHFASPWRRAAEASTDEPDSGQGQHLGRKGKPRGPAGPGTKYATGQQLQGLQCHPPKVTGWDNHRKPHGEGMGQTGCLRNVRWGREGHGPCPAQGATRPCERWYFYQVNSPLESLPCNLDLAETRKRITFPIYQHEQGHALAWIVTTVWNERRRGLWCREVT